MVPSNEVGWCYVVYCVKVPRRIGAFVTTAHVTPDTCEYAVQPTMYCWASTGCWAWVCILLLCTIYRFVGWLVVWLVVYIAKASTLGELNSVYCSSLQ